MTTLIIASGNWVSKDQFAGMNNMFPEAADDVIVAAIQRAFMTQLTYFRP